MKKVLNGILFSALFLITISSCGGMDPISQVKMENALNGSEMNLPMKFDSGLYRYNPLSTRVESDLDFAGIDAQLQKIYPDGKIITETYQDSYLYARASAEDSKLSFLVGRVPNSGSDQKNQYVFSDLTARIISSEQRTADIVFPYPLVKDSITVFESNKAWGFAAGQKYETGYTIDDFEKFYRGMLEFYQVSDAFDCIQKQGSVLTIRSPLIVFDSAKAFSEAKFPPPQAVAFHFSENHTFTLEMQYL